MPGGCQSVQTGALPGLLSAPGRLVGGLSLLTLLIFTEEQWALVRRQRRIDKRWSGRKEERGGEQIKSNVYCSVISLPSPLSVWSVSFSPSPHESVSFSLFLPLSAPPPLRHVKVLDAVYINPSIFLEGWRRDCEMMLLDNVRTNGEKNRAGRGNKKRRGGNGRKRAETGGNRPSIDDQLPPSVIFATFLPFLTASAEDRWSSVNLKHNDNPFTLSLLQPTSLLSSEFNRV